MILITGGTGLVGGEVLPLLSQSGVAACPLTRSPQKAKIMSGITWVAGDLAKPDKLSTRDIAAVAAVPLTKKKAPH